MKRAILRAALLLSVLRITASECASRAATHYVDLNSTNAVPPYTNWATAAINIQDAVGSAQAGDTVLVTDGVYAAGGQAVYGLMTNRVAVTNASRLESVNGPAVTVIQGYQVPGTINDDSAIRCVYLADGAAVVGFTLTGGATRSSGDLTNEQSGGGVWCASTNAVINNCILDSNSAFRQGSGGYRGTLNDCTISGNSTWYGAGVNSAILSNCTLIGNSAYIAGGGAYSSILVNCALNGNSATDPNGSWGGGAYQCLMTNCTITGNSSTLNAGGVGASVLYNCLLTGNSAVVGGGGAWGGSSARSSLVNCTVVANSAAIGGGTASSELYNCIVYYNTAAQSGDNYTVFGTTASYSCTTPLPTSGSGNIDLEPGLVDPGGSDVHLQTNSPCINAGINSFTRITTDLDGNPRIGGGTVDMGAYEFQHPVSVISYAWLQHYGLPTDGSADYADPDGDGMNNWQEWVAGTDPTNPASLLRLLAPVLTAPGLLLRWNSDTNHAYFIERMSSLATPVSLTPIQTNVPGAPGTTTYTDTTAPSAGGAFYRVGTDSTSGSVSLWLQSPQFVPAGVTVTWTSVSSRSYFIERATNLAGQPIFSTVATNLSGQTGTTTYTDYTTSGPGPFIYRVGVGN
jgi:hypothetical protein